MQTTDTSGASRLPLRSNHTRQAIDPILATIPAAHDMTGFSRSRLYELMGNGSIAAVKLGKRTMIRVDSLRSFVESLPPANIAPSRVA